MCPSVWVPPRVVDERERETGGNVRRRFEMSVEKGASRIDYDLMKYLILSLLMKTDVIGDERFMPPAEGRGGGISATFPSPIPIKDGLFDPAAYYSSPAMWDVSSLSLPHLFLLACFLCLVRSYLPGYLS